MTSQDASTHLRDASDAHPVPHSPFRSAPDKAPSWPPPRSPIPPHRLAKLANALGISAPVPLSQPQIDPAQSATPLSLTPEPRRSPAPSIASTPLPSHSPAPLLHSKFLLHVVPPSHIPHESDSSETFHLTPPPSSASGYHTQFERGTLVPLLPTLQSQLWAIAKEYAFPSTAGMILYLVSSSPSPNPDTTLTVPDEPGPRLSEEIWKLLWTRVAKFESDTHSRAITPNTVGLGFGYVGPPSPLFPQPFSSSSNTLRPLVSPSRVAPQSFPLPLTPTASTVSSNPPTQATFSESSQSEVDTPDSSLPSNSRAATLDLPGLTSPSLIPILARLEFDIDKRRAAWYGPWIRSRKLNHEKRERCARAASDSGTPPITESASQGDGEADTLRVAPLPLRLVDRQAIPRFLLSANEDGDDGFQRLSESPPCLEDPNPVSIALSGPAKTEGDSANGNDGEEEDAQALEEPPQERPRLSLDIPSSPLDVTVLPPVPTAGAGTTSTYKKAAPPPLTLTPYSFGASASAEPSPLPSSSSTRLAYLREGVSTPSDGDKRTGTVFDELDLGLDFEDTGEFDEDDPNDQRRSQYAFKAKLDEIEKTLVRLSPQALQHQIQPQDKPAKSPLRSPLSLSSVDEPMPGSANSLPLPSGAPRQDPPEQESKEFPNTPSPVWPSVPHSSLKRQTAKTGSSSGLEELLAMPKLSLNGTLNPMPMSPYKKSFSELEEFKAKRRELNGHELSYPEAVASSSREPTSSSSPIIPLSPDPFGRFPSSPEPSSISQLSTFLELPLKAKYSGVEVPPEHASGSHNHEDNLSSKMDAVSRPPSSRFSLDSTDEGKNNRTSASLNPVKSIKSLWKRGRKVSISSGSGNAAASQIGSGQPSPKTPPPPPVPSISSTPTPRSLTPALSSASRESVASLVIPSDRHALKTSYHDTPLLSTSQLQQSHSSPSINSMFFNQESPYPVHVLPPSITSRRRTASQTARIQSSTSLAEVDVTPPLSASSVTEKDKASVPKSILKSRRTESSASPSPMELQAARRSQSRADPAVRRSTTSGGGGRTTPPSSDSTRVSPTKSRRRSNRAPVLSHPSQDEAFPGLDSVPRLELDQRT